MKKYILSVTILLLSLSVHLYGQQTGSASYYAGNLHGRPTSNGKIYHRDSLTCAHRTYPFGTLLNVKNLRNNKEVIVKVTDRGPFVKGRIIDVSYAAAKKLEFIGHGVARVEVSKYEPLRKIEEDIVKDTLSIFKLKIHPDSIVFPLDYVDPCNDNK